jgi:hypothetical protein
LHAQSPRTRHTSRRNATGLAPGLSQALTAVHSRGRMTFADVVRCRQKWRPHLTLARPSCRSAPAGRIESSRCPVLPGCFSLQASMHSRSLNLSCPGASLCNPRCTQEVRFHRLWAFPKYLLCLNVVQFVHITHNNFNRCESLHSHNFNRCESSHSRQLTRYHSYRVSPLSLGSCEIRRFRTWATESKLTNKRDDPRISHTVPWGSTETAFQ